MKKYTFPGGVHPPDNKHFSENKRVIKITPKNKVYIQMSQHIGKPAKPIVEKGDFVKVGQLIGQADTDFSSNIHSSVSGEIIDIKNINGNDTIVIESDNKYEVVDGIISGRNIDDLLTKDVINIMKDIGLVGMGGAGFPTHVKFSVPEEYKSVMDTLIINGVECEPYLTCDHRLMLEETNDIILGIRAALKAAKLPRAVIGIEDNKKDCIEALQKATQKYDNITVSPLKTKYPQGAEKQLVYATTKRKLRGSDLPFMVGTLVVNVATIATIGKTIRTGLPLMERIVTVTGPAIESPQNLLVRIGTPISELIDFCGLKTDKFKLINGGPMMGSTIINEHAYVTKITSGILVFDKDMIKRQEESQCIRCNKCSSACPMTLNPRSIMQHTKYGRYGDDELYTLDCISCGTCSYICPARIPLLDYIKQYNVEIKKIHKEVR